MPHVRLAIIPKCDLCKAKGVSKPRDAKYDAPTWTGSWAYMCSICFPQASKVRRDSPLCNLLLPAK